MKEKLKTAIDFILNPRLLLCFAAGWMITNGWSYIFIVVGTMFNIKWIIKKLEIMASIVLILLC